MCCGMGTYSTYVYYMFLLAVIPVVSCPQLTDPSNGQVSVTGLEPFSTATYVCDPGFVLFGDEIRTCSEEGVWSKDEPTCQREYMHAYLTCMLSARVH